MILKIKINEKNNRHDSFEIDGVENPNGWSCEKFG